MSDQPQETAATPVPPSTKEPSISDELAKILKLTEQAKAQKRIRSTRAVVPDRPMKYPLEDGTIFHLRALRHSEQREIESQMLDLQNVDITDKPAVMQMFDTIETLAKARICGWENFLDGEDKPVAFEKSVNGPYPLTEASLEMIDLGLLRQIGMDIINGVRPDAATVGK